MQFQANRETNYEEIVDTTPPKITCPPAPSLIGCIDDAFFPPPTVSDTCDPSPKVTFGYQGTPGPCGPTSVTLVNSVFNGTCTGTEYAPAALLQGLVGFPGNRKTVEGAKEILIREAIAAVLNACKLQSQYPLTVNQVIAEVNAALCSNDRATILAEASTLDSLNNLGCPF